MIKKLMHIIFLSCRKATELIEKKSFVGLTIREKTQLVIHTSMCDACKKYSSQSKELDTLISYHINNFTPKIKPKDLSVSPDFKEKIIKSLDN